MARRKTDSTKEGPLNYKDLRTLNDVNQKLGNPITPITDDDVDEFLRSVGQPGNIQGLMGIQNNLGQMEDVEISSPIARTGKDYWGNSHFDEDIAVGDINFERLSDIRAENQPWYSKIVNGVGKAGVLAGTTALETVGLLYGIGQGIYNAATNEESETGVGAGGAFLHGLWDNPITNALQQINEAAEEYMPNYYTQDEIENPFSNIFTANFLGDKLLKNLGFMVGAFYGGIPGASLIGKTGTAAVKSARAAAAAERMGMATRFGKLTAGYSDDVIKNAAKYGKEIAGLSDEAAAGVAAKYGDEAVGLHRLLDAEHLTEAERGKRMLAGFDKVRDAAQTTRATSQTIGSLGSAINEGAIEAINNSKDWAEGRIQESNDKFQQKLAAIEQEYGGTEMEIALKMQAAEEHEKELAAIEKGRATMGNADLLLNIPVLMMSNMYQLGRLYSRGFDSTRRELGSIFNGHKLAGSLEKGTLASDKTWKGGVISALLKSNSEGLEEYLQRAASDGAGQAVNEAINRYLASGHSEDSKVGVDDIIAGFGKAIADNLGDPSAWEEYMIGAVSSMVGMPVFGSQTKNAYIGKNKGFGFAGGVVGNYQEYMDEKKKEEKVATYLNQRVQDPKFRKLYEHLRKHQDFDVLLEDALKDEDKRQYKDLGFEQLFEDINTAASSGHLEEFKQMVGYNHEYTDEELSDIVKETTKVITADEQKKQDQNRKAFLEGAIKNLQKEKVWTPSMQRDFDAYQEELQEVKDRLKRKYQDKKEGPFIDVNGEMNSTNPDKMREILERNKVATLEAIDNYLKIRNEIDIETDGRLEDDQISLLTMMKGKILDYDVRSAEMADDLIKNLVGIQDNYDLLRQKEQEQVDKAQKTYDTTLKQLEKAKKKNVKKKELERYEANHEEAKKKLNKAKGNINALENALKLLDMLLEEKDLSIRENMAFGKGLGENLGERLMKATRNYTRYINSDEAQAILADPKNAISLIRILENRASDLDANQKQKLMQEVVDLSVLANQKTAYNRKVREFLGDPELINESFKQASDKISQKEKDDKSRELSTRIQTAKSMPELDGIMREAFQMNPEVAKMALEKAKKEGDDDVKRFISDYEKATNFYGDFSQYIAKLPSEIRAGVMETASSEWEAALVNGVDVHDAFVEGLTASADLLVSSNNPVAKQTGEAIKKALSDLNAAKKSVATNKNTKKNSSNNSDSSDDTDKSLSSGLASLANKRKKQKEGGKATTKESVLKEIEDEIRNSINYPVPGYPGSIDQLSNEVKAKITEYNKENPDNQITDDTVLDILERLIDEKIANSTDNISKQEASNKGDNIELEEDESGSTRRDDMKKNLSVTYKSDRVSAFRFNLDYKVPYSPETEQGKAIQKLLDEYKAYQFLDKNYLGYLAKEEEHPEVFFLKSTDPAVDGNGGTESAIFIAIKWNNKVEAAIRKHGFNGKKDSSLTEASNPITFNGEQYQIVGIATFDLENAGSETQQAFASFQSGINSELNPQMEEARAANQPFVMSKMTTQIDQIYTGRLEKREDEKDIGEKSSLYDYVSSSSEWGSGMDFYFGTVVNRSLNTTQDEDITQQMEPINDAWAAKNNGAVLLYVPKPDGKLYPVRCTRRTVTEWFEKSADGQHTGEELLNKVLAGEVRNEYLGNIIRNLKTLFNPAATIGDRMQAKVMLSKYFIFGKESPIHFSDKTVTLTFGKDSYELEGDTIEDKIKDFFEVLRDEKIMFTLPSPSLVNINGRQVVLSGIFEIGLRGFYNFNSNFTIYPIDSDGNSVNVEVPEDGEGHFTGGAGNIRRGLRQYDLGDGVKDYYIEPDGTVTLNNEPVSEDVQNIITTAEKAKKGECPLFKIEMLSGRVNDPEMLKYIADNIQGFDGVFVIIDGTTRWVYDSRKGDHNVRLYRLDDGSKESPTKGYTLKEKYNKAVDKFRDSHAAELMRIRKKNKTGEAVQNEPLPETSIQEGQSEAPEQPSKSQAPSAGTPQQVGMFVGKTLDDLSAKNGGLEGVLVDNKNKPKVKDIFECLQLAEETGIPFNPEDIKAKVEGFLQAKGEEKKKLFSELLNELKGCNK